MTIQKTKDGETMTIALEGRLDTTTAPDLENDMMEDLDGITRLTFDFSKLEYISSAGLRVLLRAHKAMEKKGDMIVKGANEDIMDIFDVTGFVDIFHIE